MQGLQEGDGGESCANDGGDTGGEQAQTEQTIADVAGGQLEGLSSGVTSVDDLVSVAGGHAAGTQNGQEQQDTDSTGSQNALSDGLTEVAGALNTSVDQTVSTGEGDVAAAGAAQQGGQNDEHGGELVESNQTGSDLADGRLGDDGDDQNGDQDDGGQDGGDLIHNGLSVLVQEDDDAQAAGHNGADLLGQADHGVEAQSDAADVTDVESQTADGDDDGQEHAQTGQQLVGDILSAHAGNADDGPDVHLGSDIHDDGAQNDHDQGSAVLSGELRSLGQEAGADGGSSHQEGGAEQNGSAGLLSGSIVTHNLTSKFLLGPHTDPLWKCWG